MTARNLMVFPKELNRSFFEQLLDGQTEIRIASVVIDTAEELSDWNGYVPRERIVLRSDLLTPSSDPETTPYHTRWYETVLAALMADSRSFYILERHYRAQDPDIFFNSVFNRTVDLELIVWNTLTFLHRTQPDRIVHYNIPHGLLWFVARIAELTGVEVLAAAISPLPWKEWIVRGLDQQVPLDTAAPRLLSPAGRIADFKAMIRGSYDAAMPSYEKERFDSFRGGFFSLKKELRSIGGTLLTTRSVFATAMRALMTIRKRTVIQTYDRLTQGFRLPEKYVVYFLHYQPERTTLPDGGGYAQQWLALRALSAALPPGYKLLVKEHPSTFRYHFHAGFRAVDFHERISRLPNTALVPLGIAPYPLIDGCAAVATVTGTVGVEAILRGKPVLVFGAAQYRGVQGVYPVASTEAVRTALESIENGAGVASEADLDRYLEMVDTLSFPVWEGTWPGALTPDLTVVASDVLRAAIYAETEPGQTSGAS